MRRLLLVLLAIAAAPLLAAAPAHAAVRLTSDGRAPLPESFVGLSVETTLVNSWFTPGSCQSPARTALRELGRPEMRIGGNSQDRLGPSQPLTKGDKQLADPTLYHALHCLSSARSPILLGLNLLGRDPQDAGDILAAAASSIPRELLTISVGNEPNLYGGRLPKPGDYAGYLKLYGDTMNALRARFGGFLPPIVGPDAATYRWQPQTVNFIRDFKPAQVDAHMYGLNGCKSTTAPPSVAGLLDRAASSGLVGTLKGIATAARLAHIPAQISEANTVACSGAHDISDAPASALWGMETFGAAQEAGFSRFELHSSQGFYDPFIVNADGTVSFRPIFSSMVLANWLWPQGTRPLHLKGTSPAGLGAFAARRPNGHVGVMVINRDPDHAQTLDLHTAAPEAVYGRVLARGAHAVTLDGRQVTWADGAPRWRGHERVRRLHAKHGRIALTLQPRSGAWLILGDHLSARGATHALR